VDKRKAVEEALGRELTDAEWAALELEPVGEIALPDGEVVVPEAVPDAAVAALMEQVNALGAKIEELQTARPIEVAASAIDPELERLKRGEIRASNIAKASEDMLVAATLTPSRETVDALYRHLIEHGGLITIPKGEVGASNIDPPLDDTETQINALPLTPVGKAKVRGLVTGGMSVGEAHVTYLRGLNAGR
jgi:hypothetical protein